MSRRRGRGNEALEIGVVLYYVYVNVNLYVELGMNPDLQAIY